MKQSFNMKPLRAAAVIRTPYGLLLGGDSYKDLHRNKVLAELEAKRLNALRKKKMREADRLSLAKTLVEEQGRLSLIGGKVEPKDYTKAEVDTVINVESSNFEKELATTMKVIRKAIAREVLEELGLTVDQDSVQFIRRIIGENRNHIICTVFAQGEVIIDHNEILGLGLMTGDLPAIPQNHYFYQHHAIDFRRGYLSNPEEAKKIREMPVSRLQISQSLIFDLYRHQCDGSAYAQSRNRFSERATPKMLRSTTNFFIIGGKEPIPKTERPPSPYPLPPTPYVGVVGKVPSD